MFKVSKSEIFNGFNGIIQISADHYEVNNLGRYVITILSVRFLGELVK